MVSQILAALTDISNKNVAAIAKFILRTIWFFLEKVWIQVWLWIMVSQILASLTEIPNKNVAAIARFILRTIWFSLESV